MIPTNLSDVYLHRTMEPVLLLLTGAVMFEKPSFEPLYSQCIMKFARWLIGIFSAFIIPL